MPSKASKSSLITPEIAEKVVQLRREIHMYPELQYQEVKTQAVIIRELKALGIKAKKMAGTGVHAVIRGTGKSEKEAIMLRADMDALPIEEDIAWEYRSKHPGKMHACGHDAHVAMLLTAAKLLKENPVGGDVVLCFQPAEEGGTGSQKMIDDGVLDNPKVGAAFGIHVWSGIPSGKMGITFGPCMAAVDEFEVKVRGVGGHAAYPQAAVDPILISSQIISALHTIVSRNIDPIETGVVTVGSISGGTSFNIIPPEVILKGTVRTFTEENRKKIRKRFYEIVEGFAKSMGGSVEIVYRHQIPATVNDKASCDLMWEASADVLGKKNVFEARPMMGGEDMSLYLLKVPGCFGFLGAMNLKKESTYAHHHPKFRIDEDVLPSGVEILYRTAERYHT